jgi:DNA-directed RNA polymerase sigma subunit (sigma70/sigma32)
MGLSKERVRQLEKGAFKKLRTAITDQVDRENLRLTARVP